MKCPRPVATEPRARTVRDRVYRPLTPVKSRSPIAASAIVAAHVHVSERYGGRSVWRGVDRLRTMLGRAGADRAILDAADFQLRRRVGALPNGGGN